MTLMTIMQDNMEDKKAYAEALKARVDAMKVKSPFMARISRMLEKKIQELNEMEEQQS